MPTPRLSDELMQQAVDAVAAHGSQGAAGRALGIVKNTFEHRYRQAIKAGFEPQAQALLAGDKAAAAEGYRLKGTSTLYDFEGHAKLQWVKTSADQEKLEAAQRAALAVMCEEIKPIAPITGPRAVEKDLATLYTITDVHIGMLAWAPETGE